MPIENSRSGGDDDIRDIHAISAPSLPNRARSDGWETGSLLSSGASVVTEFSSDRYTSMSREFNALVLAGSTIENNSEIRNNQDAGSASSNRLDRIGEDREEINPLAIVPDSTPLDPSPSPRRITASSSVTNSAEEVSIDRVKKEEVESKISAWQTAEISKINNKFKRQEAVISGREREEVQKATTRMKKVERKLEEKRARALEKMENDVAKAHRDAEEKKASAEAQRGIKISSVLEVAALMRAVGRAPSRHIFF